MQRFFIKIFWTCPEGRAFRCNLFAQRQQKVFPLQSLTLVPQVILFVAMVLKSICYCINNVEKCFTAQGLRWTKRCAVMLAWRSHTPAL